MTAGRSLPGGHTLRRCERRRSTQALGIRQFGELAIKSAKRLRGDTAQAVGGGGPQASRVTPKAVVVLSPEEVAQLLAAFRAPTYYAIASFL